MAKSSRSSTRKANNQRLAANIFGPAEAARAERLSAKLLEIVKQQKPESSDVSMDAEDNATVGEKEKAEDEASMDVDSVKPTRARIEKKRIDKRKQKKSGIVFKKYNDRQKKKSTK